MTDYYPHDITVEDLLGHLQKMIDAGLGDRPVRVMQQTDYDMTEYLPVGIRLDVDMRVGYVETVELVGIEKPEQLSEQWWQELPWLCDKWREELQQAETQAHWMNHEYRTNPHPALGCLTCGLLHAYHRNKTIEGE